MTAEWCNPDLSTCKDWDAPDYFLLEIFCWADTLEFWGRGQEPTMAYSGVHVPEMARYLPPLPITISTI